MAALPAGVLRIFARSFGDAMREGLTGRKGACLAMLPSHVSRLPAGTEAGTFYALDLGGTNFRVLTVQLAGRGAPTRVQAREIAVPPDVMRSDAARLFGFLADGVATAVGPAARDRDARPRPRLGFTFSFAVEQTALNSGTLLLWTKGFDAAGVVGEDVVSLLQRELHARGVYVDVSALCNDTVGLLCAARYTDPRAELGVILGTGTNACYVEKAPAIVKWDHLAAPIESGEMVVNTEWGGFTSPLLPWTFADRALDAESINPGQQHLEKMLSGMYLGEIVRRFLLRMAEDGGVAGISGSPQALDRLATPGSLDTPTVSAIEADRSAALERARQAVEERIGCGAGSCPLETRMLVKELCQLVRRRAARLAAASTVAVLRHAGLDTGTRPVTVAVDGGLYEHYAEYRDDMDAAMRELLGEAAGSVRCVLQSDGSGLGAALIAAAS